MVEALCLEKGINVLILNKQYYVEAGSHKWANTKTYFMQFNNAHYSGLEVIKPQHVHRALQKRFPDRAAPSAGVPPIVTDVTPHVVTVPLAVTAAPTDTAAPTVTAAHPVTDDVDVDTATAAATSSNKRVRYSNSLHGAVHHGKYSVNA